MPTDSINSLQARRGNGRRQRGGSRVAARLGLGLSGLALLLTLGCLSKPPTIVVDELLEPLAQPRPWMPSAADLAAAKLAREALVRGPTPESMNGPAAERKVDPRVEAALERIDSAELSKENEHLVTIATDVRNATLDDPIAYRAASRKLRKQRGLDPRLESRLDRTIDDDPIHLARRRQLDGWHRLWARTFNSVSEPLGNSLITGFVIAPFQLANSIIHYFAEFSNAEPLSHTGRQALALRRDFLARHPDTELTEALERKIARRMVLLDRTFARRRVHTADRALDVNQPRLALHHAKTAIQILEARPEENPVVRKQAQRLAKRAEKAIGELERRRARSLEARWLPPRETWAEQRLAGWILAGALEPEALEAELQFYTRAAGKDGPPRADFVRSIAMHEAGFEDEAWARLASLSDAPGDGRAMGRHARKLIGDDWQNPYGAFVRLRRQGVRNELSWRLAGEWLRRPRYPNLPGPVSYLIDAPTIAMTIVLAPLRALTSPWTGTPDFQRASALAGYRYLVRFPDGSRQRRVVDWLFDYEYDAERWPRALRLADLKSDFDPERRLELVELTASSQLEQVDEIERRDARASILEGVAKDYPDSDSGQAAGLLARETYEDASPQHIRITKSFLLENPSVASRDGLGLNPKLLNDDPADGELHPNGVQLRGGRVVEFLLVADGGDHKDPPESKMRRISKQRLSRVAATLDEAVRRNSLIDVDARQKADATRDVYLERANLGLTDEVDMRPSAESTFVYQSLRERYGAVRGRDSVLPFDLVFRGSLGDFTLGAFPRWRAPRETPDAFLYR